MTPAMSSPPASLRPACHIVNLQPALGGAEVYTMFFARAMAQTGCATSLYVRRGVRLWDHLAQHQIRLVEVDRDVDIPIHLEGRSWLVTHAPVTEAFVAAVRGKHWLTGFCHMPLAGRRAGVLAHYDLVYGVSRYVLSTLGPAGIKAIYPEPLYGVAEFERGEGAAEGVPLMRTSCYSWDRRKWRDRFLARLEPMFERLRPAQTFSRLPGVTLGIVSNIGPIKQFDLLFDLIAQQLSRHTEVRLEIFGRGGYRSVADLKHGLGPMRSRTRFWGHQVAPHRIYPELDFLMTGLPEKEALGLNVIEAQVSGTPVLAVNAPPFTETVVDGVTGYLYRDPRTDGAADFAAMLERALHASRLHPAAAVGHLHRFSKEAFLDRAKALVDSAEVGLLSHAEPLVSGRGAP